MSRIISDEEIFDAVFPNLPHIENKSPWITDRDRAIAKAQRDNSDVEQLAKTEVEVVGEVLLLR